MSDADPLAAHRLAPLAAPPADPKRDPLGFPGYPDQLARAGQRSGGDESLTVGTAELDGLPVVAAVGRFDFLGGSMGAAHGERLVAAAAHAREQGWPLVAVTTTGGARMQEGMVALTQMSRAAEAMRRLRTAGVPTLALLRHPTTGGVLASYGSLADVRLAEAGATIGFAGPRVVETVTGRSVGDDSHRAEHALAAGLVDEVAAAEALSDRAAAYAGLLHPHARRGAMPAGREVAEPTGTLEAWEAVQRARDAARPTARDALDAVFDAHVELHGDRRGADDPVAIAALARLGRRTVMVVGLDRAARAEGEHRLAGQPVAAGYRKLQRALALAARHDLPVVSLIDTPGADPSPASEREGLAGEIAETFVATLSAPAPTVAVVLGEGGSGGALAIGCADALLQQDDAVFEVIAVEGAASILYRDAARARDVAGWLRPTAADLRGLGVVDRVLPGPTTHGAEAAHGALRGQLAATLASLDADPDRAARREQRYGPGATGG